MSFAGFGPEALPFFKALAFHQSKEWFEENRTIYESQVKQPFGDLIEDLTERFAAEGIPLKGSRKGSLFRLNKDVRFSKSKDLYKTHAGGPMSRTGAKLEPGILYIHIDPQGCFLGAAFYRPEPDTLLKLRGAARRDPKAYRAMLAALKKRDLSLSEGESLSRLPRGFDDVTEPNIAEAVRRKSFLLRQPIDDVAILDAGFVDRVAGFAKAALPLLTWGWNAIADER